MTTPAAIFFDLDGTLIDTAPDMGGALNTVLQNHQRASVPLSRSRAFVSDGSIALLRLGFPELDPATQMAELREEFLATYARDIAVDSALFAGMEKVLAQLETRDIPWGIITNKPEQLTLKLLDQLELTDRACCIIGADTASHAKPHPAPMLLACERTSVKPAQCIYIGDAPRDIVAGNAVDMLTAIASWGYIEADSDTSNWGADVWLEKPAQIIDLLSS